MNIAVTGNIGCGKSGVTSIIGGMLCAEVIDADDICRELLLPGNQGYMEIRSQWGERFFKNNGELERSELRQAVFSDEQIRVDLENILHPLVQNSILQRMNETNLSEKNLIAEIPLLFEVNWADKFDRVISVFAPEDVCRLRTVLRDGVSADHVDSIFALQMDPEKKAARADYVIDNSGIWSSTVLQASVVVRYLGQNQLIHS
jgi:dephospho-CoA kinase